jgi:hypothetical protein
LTLPFYCSSCARNSFLFKRFRTLCENHPGRGYVKEVEDVREAKEVREVKEVEEVNEYPSFAHLLIHPSHCARRRSVPQLPGTPR